MSTKLLLKKVITLEIIGFTVILILLWLDEILDIPHLLFNSIATPINWVESIWESVLVLFFGIIVVILSRQSLNRIKYLEGFLVVCSYCKKIRVYDKWIPIEEYMKKHSDVFFSHSMCPDCIKKHYGNFI